MNAVPIVLGLSMVVLILLGLTSIFVGGYYFVRLVAAYWRGRSYEAARTKDESRSQASEMAWLALKVGLILGLFFGAPIGHALLVSKPSGPALGNLASLICVCLVSGAIAAAAFWTSSAFLRQARKKLKRFRGAGIWDRELDGAP